MALTKVTGDFIKDGVLTQAHLHSSHGITSTHIGEGDKLFFTNARARGAISVSGNALSYNSSTGVITSNFEESPTFTGNVSVSGTTFLDGDVTIGDTSSAFIGMARAGANYLAATNASGELLFRTAGSNLAFTLDTNQNAIFASAVWMPDYLYHHGDADTYMGYPTNNEWKVTVGGSTKIFADSNKAYLYYQGGLKLQTTSSGIEVTGDGDFSGQIFVGTQNSTFAENNLRFKSSGAAYIDHNTVGQSFIFRTSASSSLDTTALTIASNGNATFIGDITSKGLTVDYTGNRTGDAGILVTNDNNDWGIKVDKDGTADYGILSQTDGENAIVVRNAAGVNKIQLQGDGDATFAGAITASGDIVAPGIYVGSANTSYDFYNNGTSYLNGTVTVDADLNFTAGDFNIGGVRIVGDNDSADQGTAFIRSNGDYLVMNAADGEHVYLNWDSANGGSGHVYIDNALYAQIFYDRNDTGRYLNPNGTSRIDKLEVANTGNQETPGAYLKIGSDGFIFGGNNSGYEVNSAQISAGYHTANSLNFVGMGTNSSNRRMDFWAEGGFYVSGTIYDKDNTNFYLNPGDSDRALKTYGSVSIGTVGHLGLGDTSHPKVVYPGKEASWDGSGTTTGAVVITLPGTLAHYDMMYMEIDVYEYSGDNATKIIIGGHNWNSGGNSNTSTTMWYNTGVKVIGSFSKPIYFGWRNDGTNNRRVIVLGDTNSSWSYGTVHVSKVSGACYYTDSIDYMGDWVVAQTTSSSYYTKSPTTNHNSTTSPTLVTYGSVRGSVFYDRANTAYYVDPDSTTSLRTVGSWRADSSTWDGEFNGKIQHHGNWWYMQASNGVLIRNSSGANNITLSASGVGTAANDWRAPYFYDSNDTTYYLDPAGTSITRSISIMQGSGLNLYQSGNGSYAYQDARAEGSYSAVYKGTNNGSAYGAYREYWYDGDSYHSLQISGNRWYFNAPLSVTNDVRAPIFYDSDDTNYYVNPASNSVMNTINGFGFSQTGGNGKILVTHSSNGYLYLNNWIYVDGAGLFSGTNGAHFYPNGSSDYGAWRMNGTRNGWNGITFDVNGTNNTLMASEHTMGFYNDANNEWMLECQRNSHTRLYYNGVEQAKTENGYFSANNQMRAPIYYDSNNTGFYFDGAGTSRVDSIMLRSTINFPTNSPGTTHGSSHRPAYAIYQEGGAWSSPFPDLCIAMHTGIKLGAHASYNGIRFFTDYDMSTQVMAVNDSSSPAGASNVYINNYALAGGSFRAPIYYDSNNTNFYTRPSTSSLINHLYTDGTIQAGTSGTGNIYLGNNGGNGTGNHFRFHTNNSHTYFDGNCGDIHWRQGSSTRFIFYMTSANMTVNGTVTQNSDERIKENIITIDSALNKVNQLRGVYYNRTDINTSQKQIGLIAQEVENVIPEVVLTANDELGTKSISYGQINALLIEAIKEQQTIIDDLKSRIETLENQ